MAGRAHRGAVDTSARGAAPARIGVTARGIELVDEDVDGARIDGAGQRDRAGLQRIGVGDKRPVRGRAADRGRVLVDDGHAKGVELVGAVGQRTERAGRGEGGAGGGERVGAAVVAQHSLAGHVARGALEHGVDQKPASQVDGRADEQKQDGRDQGEFDQGLTELPVLQESHQAVVARLDPVIVMPPPRMLRSLNP